MSDPENFLTRWSRRKQDVAKEDARQDAKPDEVKSPDFVAKADAAAAPAEPVAPEPFDPGKLPSLDDITAETDVTAFLRPGVPTDLARAALRRAWSSDPAVRDFVGLQENDWVFNPPGAKEFGPLGPEHDVRKLLARVFGETTKEEEEEKEEKEEKSAAANEDSTSAGQIAGAEQIVGAEVDERSEPTTTQTIRKPDEPVVVQRNSADSNSRDEISTRRSHGGALPRPVSET